VGRKVNERKDKMVNLVRYRGVPESEKRAVDGPIPGGYFFTLENSGFFGENWEQMETITVSLQELLANGYRVWVGKLDIENPDWKELHSEKDLPKFSIQTTEKIAEVTPFLPQFYVLPRHLVQEWQ
jgi:hypothetical protein